MRVTFVQLVIQGPGNGRNSGFAICHWWLDIYCGGLPLVMEVSTYGSAGLRSQVEACRQAVGGRHCAGCRAGARARPHVGVKGRLLEPEASTAVFPS